MDKQPSGFSAKQAFSVFWRIFRRYMCRFPGPLAMFFLCAAAAVAFSVLGPRVLGLATTRIFTDSMAAAKGTGNGIDFPYLMRIAAVLLALYAGSALCQYLQGRVMTRITNRSTYFIRQDIAAKLNRLPLTFFEDQDRSEVLSFVTNDADVIAFSLNQVMTQLINTALTLIGITAVMFSMSWFLALAVLCVVPITLLLSRWIGHASQHRFDTLQASLADMTAHASDTYLLQDILRSGKGRRAQLQKFDRLNETIYAASWRAQFVSGALLPALSAVSSFAYIAVCILGSLLAIRGLLTIGEIQAFIQYVRSFTQPITQLATIHASVQHILAAAGRIFAFLDCPEQTPAAGTESASGIRGAVVFDGVSVADGSGQALLQAVSFSVPAGAKVAVTGRHGSGKSVLLRALLGLYPLSGGRITVDGQDLQGFSSEARRDLFTAAFQQPWLETDTIAANIRYGQRDAAAEEVERAASRIHGARELIAAAPSGYETELGERWRNLSRGQAGLMQLARTILREACIPVLDDAVQDVDPLTKQKILDEFLRSPDKTVFLATGRLDDLQRADIVLILEDGHLSAAGTLRDVSRSAAFRNLFGDASPPKDPGV